MEITDEGPAVTVVSTRLTYREAGVLIEKTVRLRMIYEDPGGNLAVRGKEGGTWVLLNWRTA